MMSTLPMNLESPPQPKGIMRVKTLRDSLNSVPHSSLDKTSTVSESENSTRSRRSFVIVEDDHHQSIDGELLENLDKNFISSVGFKHIAVREYAVIIGDNPSCSGGAPIR